MELEKYGTAADIQRLLAVRDHIDALLNGDPPDDDTGPNADLVDLGDAYQLIVEVPGVPRENLEIAIEDGELVVAGIREPLAEGLVVLKTERRSGHFQRVIELPGTVDREASTAALRDGLLIVTMPKA